MEKRIQIIYNLLITINWKSQHKFEYKTIDSWNMQRERASSRAVICTQNSWHRTCFPLSHHQRLEPSIIAPAFWFLANIPWIVVETQGGINYEHDKVTVVVQDTRGRRLSSVIPCPPLHSGEGVPSKALKCLPCNWVFLNIYRIFASAQPARIFKFIQRRLVLGAAEKKSLWIN